MGKISERRRGRRLPVPWGDRGLGVHGGQDVQDDRMVTNHEVCGGDPVHPDILSKTDSCQVSKAVLSLRFDSGYS
jgi:hypothetical protein